jgi:hypothetical protein
MFSSEVTNNSQLGMINKTGLIYTYCQRSASITVHWSVLKQEIGSLGQFPIGAL